MEENSFETLKADLTKLRRRAKEARHLDCAPELAGNVYPTLIAMLEAIDERLEETESQVVALIQQTESVIQPELGLQILATLDMAKNLCDAVEKDEDVKPIIETLRTAIGVTYDAVNDTMVELPDEEGEEGEEGEETEEASAEPGEEAKPATSAVVNVNPESTVTEVVPIVVEVTKDQNNA